MSIKAIMSECQNRGIRLDVKLKVDAPKGRMTDDLMDALQAHKPEILAALVDMSRLPVPDICREVSEWAITCGECRHSGGGLFCEMDGTPTYSRRAACERFEAGEVIQ